MTLKKLICSCCGGELVIKNDTHYLCPYCKAMYEKDNAEEMQEILSNILEQEKLERLSTARRSLFDAVHAKYPSEKVVINATNNVLSINPDDPLALAILYSHDESANELSKTLPYMEVDINTADEIFNWMMRHLSPRQVTSLSEFIQRHYQGKELVDHLTRLEDEVDKLEQGYYLSSAPRDVFLCYSSSDMPEVIKTISALEDNGFYCFAAFRNLRHGRAAKENYLREIEQAIHACKVFVFISTKNSRSVYCDSIRVELPYLTKLANKERVEYMLDSDDKNTPLLVRKLLKEAFPTQERVYDEDSLILRVDALIKEMNNPKKSHIEIDLEELNKKQKALDEKLKALEEAEKRTKEETNEEKLDNSKPKVMKELTFSEMTEKALEYHKKNTIELGRPVLGKYIIINDKQCFTDSTYLIMLEKGHYVDLEQVDPSKDKYPDIASVIDKVLNSKRLTSSIFIRAKDIRQACFDKEKQFVVSKVDKIAFMSLNFEAIINFLNIPNDGEVEICFDVDKIDKMMLIKYKNQNAISAPNRWIDDYDDKVDHCIKRNIVSYEGIQKKLLEKQKQEQAHLEEALAKKKQTDEIIAARKKTIKKINELLKEKEINKSIYSNENYEKINEIIKRYLTIVSSLDDVYEISDCVANAKDEVDSVLTIEQVETEKYEKYLKENFIIRDDVLLNYIGKSEIVNVPEFITKIASKAFYGDMSVKTIIIQHNVRIIDSYAFWRCDKLSSIVIHGGLQEIGAHAFEECKSLEHVLLPESLLKIGEDAFYFCEKLTSINIPEGVNFIGKNAFKYCSSLKSITLPNNLRTIEYGVFENCSGLQKIDIPSSVTSICDCAFSGCSSIASLNIPNSVVSIGDSAFKLCNLSVSISIPDSITSIGNYVFQFCSIRQINIPNSVTSIGEYAFRHCVRLTSINIPKSVITIKNGAFCECEFLEDIHLTNGLTSIGSSAFERCLSLKSIIIPGSIKYIGDSAFYDCLGLETIYSNNPGLIKRLSGKSKNVFSQTKVKKTLLGYEIKRL